MHLPLRLVEVDFHDELVLDKLPYALGDLVGGLREVKVSCDDHKAIFLGYFLCCEFSGCCARGNDLLVNGDLKLDNFFFLLWRGGYYISMILPCGLVHLYYLKFVAVPKAFFDNLHEYRVGVFVH